MLELPSQFWVTIQQLFPLYSFSALRFLYFASPLLTYKFIRTPMDTAWLRCSVVSISNMLSSWYF
jgi:hypothetical protein